MVEFGNSFVTENSSMNLPSHQSLNDFMSDKDEDLTDDSVRVLPHIDIKQIKYLLNLYPIDILCLQNITMMKPRTTKLIRQQKMSAIEDSNKQNKL